MPREASAYSQARRSPGEVVLVRVSTKDDPQQSRLQELTVLLLEERGPVPRVNGGRLDGGRRQGFDIRNSSARPRGLEPAPRQAVATLLHVRRTRAVMPATAPTVISAPSR